MHLLADNLLNIYFMLMHFSGDGSKQVRVGQLCTPVGTLHISVAYRTKMTISPTASGGVAVAGGAGPVTGGGTGAGAARDNLLMLKSDHFRRDASPKRQTTRLGRVV